MKMYGTSQLVTNSAQTSADVPGDVSTTSVITVGTAISGTIDQATATTSDQDWFKVDLTAGQTYYFSLVGSGAHSLSDGYLTLYSNTFGNYTTTLFSDNDGGAGKNAFFTYAATTSGSYYVAASGFAWASGQYTLNSGVVAADTIPADITTTASLTINAPKDGLATGSDDHDWYAVTLTVGVTYDFSLIAKSIGGTAALDYGLLNVLYYNGADTQYVASSYFTANEGGLHTYYTATQTGTYYIEAGSFTYGGIFPSPHTNGGGYTVGFTTAPADIDANGPVHLNVGESRSSLISSSSDTDTYQVTLSAGQRISVALLSDGVDPTQTTSLRIGSDTSLGDVYNNMTSHLTFTAATTGTYTIYAGGFHGTYTIVTEAIGRDVAGDKTTTGKIAVGQTLHSELSDGTDADAFAITLTAGKTYIFTANGLYDDSAPKLQLLQANGSVLAVNSAADYNHKSELLYTATASGTYYIQMSSPGAVTSNEYALSVQLTDSDIGQTVSTARSVALGEVVSSQLDFGGDQDWYGLSVISGQTYSLDVYATGDNALDYISMAMQSSNVYQVVYTDYNSSTNEVHLRFTATATGTAYFDISNNYGQRGEYTLRAGLLDTISNFVDTSASLTMGVAVNGTIDYKAGGGYGEGGDSDWYSVTLDAGKSYVFTANGSGSLPVDATVSLRDENGNVVYTSTGGYHQQQFYAAQGGTYYVVVGNNDYQLGGYTVRAAQTTDIFDQSNTVTTLAMGSTIHSAIDSATDQDWIKVTLVAGQSYLFSATPEGASVLGNTTLSIIDGASNNSVANSSDGPGSHDAALRYTATRSGTYYINVQGTNGATGNYAVTGQAVAAQNPADAVEGAAHASHTVYVYFASSGQSYGGHTASQGWSPADIANFMTASSTWSGVANVTFVQVATAGAATLIALQDGTATGALASGTAPNGADVAIINPAVVGAVTSVGSAAFDAYLTATGHALGLVAPGAWAPGHAPLEPAANLDQHIYSVMSSGTTAMWGGWYDPYPAHETGPMALDVAAIQAMYGAVARNTGNTTYNLPHTGFVTIWDTGGTDTIALSNNYGGVIDLRAATLNSSASGGGGYISTDASGLGGYTIAHGVVIENAIGGKLGDTLYGNDANNVLSGGGGDDTLWGGLGNDTISGGDGTDIVTFAQATAGVTVDFTKLTAQATGEGTDTITGVEVFYGSGFDDRVTVASTTTSVDGGLGTDTLVFKGNYANYLVGSNGTAQPVLNGPNTSVAFSNFEYFQFADRTVSYAQLMQIPVSITGDLSLETVKSGSVVITQADLDFDHTGRSSAIYTVTNTNNGSVYVDNVLATTFTSAQLEGGHVSFHQNGTDAAYAGFAVVARDGDLNNAASVSSYVEIRVASGHLYSGNDGNNVLYGSAGEDLIQGNGGNDTLHGTTGDLLYGGSGDDILDASADGGLIDGGDGTDTLYLNNAGAAVSVDLVFGRLNDHYGIVGIENVTGSNFADTIAGDDNNNVLNGAGGADRMGGAGGNDTYYVDNAGDVIDEQAYGGIDTVYAWVSHTLEANVENLIMTGTGNINGTGNNSHNIITGNSGNNILNGNSGADVMTGGLGDDSFFVDNAGDKVVELTGQGTDSVYSSVTFSLGGQYIENLTLTGTASINATGNGLNNTLVGNSGNNVLNGGVGADVMSGGLGNDTYYIDNTGDQVTELTGQGTDTVISSLSYALGDFIENLTLTGSANLNGVGNGLGNTITGNAGNNTIVGGQGADTMIGGLGNDTFYVDNVGDKVVELTGQGTDSVVSSVSFSLGGQYIENLTLGGTANINATGNGLGNVIVGNAGNNTLDGFVGNDTLTGGAGADIFLFGAGSSKDTITDFSAAQNDTLNLHAYTQANVILTQVGNDTVIDLGGGNTITVTGALKADVTSHIVW